MKKYLVGFIAGVAIAAGAAAVAAVQVSGAVKVTCWDDGSVHVETLPK